MDVVALVLFILAALVFLPWPGNTVDVRWGWVLLTVGTICQWTHVTGNFVTF